MAGWLHGKDVEAIINGNIQHLPEGTENKSEKNDLFKI
jgi:hypothetical protein